MEKILNLTQHIATKEQIEVGVFEPENKNEVKEFLTFNKIPTKTEIVASAIALASLAKEECEKHNCKKVMIGGAPYLMSALERWLKKYGLQPVYAFSKRVSIDEPQPNGSVIKKAIFKHEGFIEISLGKLPSLFSLL